MATADEGVVVEEEEAGAILHMLEEAEATAIVSLVLGQEPERYRNFLTFHGNQRTALLLLHIQKNLRASFLLLDAPSTSI